MSAFKITIHAYYAYVKVQMSIKQYEHLQYILIIPRYLDYFDWYGNTLQVNSLQK